MDAILKLKKSGELYEPKSGLIKPVEQQPMW
jgi:hypothetical protein